MLITVILSNKRLTFSQDFLDSDIVPADDEDLAQIAAGLLVAGGRIVDF